MMFALNELYLMLSGGSLWLNRALITNRCDGDYALGVFAASHGAEGRSGGEGKQVAGALQEARTGLEAPAQAVG